MLIFISVAHKVGHGDPDDATKHVGDLGSLDLDSVPDDWPKGVKTCEMVMVIFLLLDIEKIFLSKNFIYSMILIFVISQYLLYIC